MELFQAHTQWANRPPDERYQSLAALTEAVASRRAVSMEVDYTPATFAEMDFEHLSADLKFGGATLTHWSLGQMAGLVRAPAKYLRTLPSEMVAPLLEHGLRNRFEGSDNDMRLLTGTTDEDGTVLRAVTSGKYTRVWDADLLHAINQHADGFHPPLGYKDGEWGAEMVPSGLYASDHDVFALLIKEDEPIEIGNEVLHRFFMASNSEVGGGSLWGCSGYHRKVCGNNIIWGATQVNEVRVRHVGDKPWEILNTWIPEAFERLRNAQSTNQEREVIVAATKEELAKDTEEAIEFLRKLGFTKAESTLGVEAAEREERDPFTRWGLLQGLTAHARTITRIDNRVDLERRAAALLPVLN